MADGSAVAADATTAVAGPARLSTSRLIAHAAVSVGALVLGLVTLGGAKASDIGSWGLITSLPAPYFISLGLLAASFLVNLNAGGFSLPLAIVHAVFLTILLNAPPDIIEPLPRTPGSWLHAGFTDYIAHTGLVAAHLDARFNWPSFFAGSAILSRSAGLPSAVKLIPWWPVGIDLLYLLPLWGLAGRLLPTTRHAALVLFLFPLANWVGQDYFSPQSIGLFLYLTFVAVVLSVFPGRSGAARPFAPAWLDPDASDPASIRLRIAMLAVLVILGLAMATGHQLTPVAAVLVILGLEVTRRTNLRAFGPFLFLAVLAWVCYGAIDFWSGHTGLVFGGLGHPLHNLERDFFGRIKGTSTHSHIASLRSGLAGVLWASALAGFVIAPRVKVDRRAPAVLVLAAAPVIIGQSYGGEALLRVYLFSIPGALVLASIVLLRRNAWIRGALVTASVALLIPAFLVARWGNELFEQVKLPQLAAIEALDSIAPAGSQFIALNLQVPWEFADVTKFRYLELRNFNHPSTSAVEAAFKRKQSGYVVITQSEVDYGIQTYGLSRNWAATLGQQMVASGAFRLVYHNSEAWIYYFNRARASGGGGR